jgi:hypothetical protein
MNSNKRGWRTALAIVIAITQAAYLPPMLANDRRPAAAPWSVQVEKINPANVPIESAFTAAIYENLLEGLNKTKKFSHVFRSGDRNAAGGPDLLILKTIVQAYTPGSETKRAVTTVMGATKLKVETQLVTGDGQVLMERSLDGNVRFFGGNLRATHNLARNIANAVEKSKLPQPGFSASSH